MMNSGAMQFVTADTVFAKYKINPPWERLHAAILWLYIAFLVTFGLSSITGNPSCLPINGTNTDELTDSEAKFVSDYCEEFADHEDPGVTILVILVSLIYQKVVSSICLGVLGMKDTFSIFSKAEKLFSELPETKKDGKSLFQKLLDDPASKKLRDVAELLWAYEPGKIVLSMVSREVTLLTGTIGNAVAIWYWVTTTPISPLFQCEAAFEFGWSSSNSTQFTCMRLWVEERANLAWFYLVIVMVHVTLRFFSLTATVVFLAHVKPHPKVASAKGFLLVNSLWVASRTKPERKFGEFVAAALSEDAANKMNGHIQSVGSDADPLLYKFTVATASRKPDADALVRDRRWKWIKYLLDKKFENLDTAEVLGDNTPDENGNSLLYYVLNKKPGNHFCVHTAIKILRHSSTVVCGGVKMSAEEFIEEQYLNDSTYPERLKNRLIDAIDEKRKNMGRSDDNLIDIEDPSTN